MFHHHHHHSEFPSARQRIPHIMAHVGMALVIGTVHCLFFGCIAMLLWNAIMPPLLGVGHITFWHSIGLLLLSQILVGGFHRGHSFRRRHMHGFRGHEHPFRRPSFDQWWHEVGEKSFREFANRPTESR